EEIFTQPKIGQKEREGFVLALKALAESGLVWVIATMRSDFFDRLATLPALAALSSSAGRFLLAPPGPGEIGQIIGKPAREAGLRFETLVQASGEELRPWVGLSLDEVLREAASRDPGALPLLEFALDQLWQRRSEDGVLTFRAYQELGGLEGALGQRAEEVFLAQPEEVRSALPGLLGALVTVSQVGKGSVTARPVAMELLPPGSPRRRLAEAFLAPGARLLVADGEGGGSRIRVSHEALLTHWARARTLIAENRADLELRARLEQACMLWHGTEGAERSDRLLRTHLAISEAADLLQRRRDELGEAVVSYIEASIAEDLEEKARQSAVERRRIEQIEAAKRAQLLAEEEGKRTRLEAERNQAELAAASARRIARRTRQGAMVLLVLLLGAMGLGFFAEGKRREARQSATEARESAVRAEVALRLAAERAGEALLAQSRLVAGLLKPQMEMRSPDQLALLARLIIPTDLRSPDRPFLGEAWDLFVAAVMRDQARAVLRHHFGPVTAGAFSGDGKRVATASQDGGVTLWDATTGTWVADLRGHDAAVTRVAFNADGTRLVSAAIDRTLRLWETASGRELAFFVGHEGAVLDVSFNGDGGRIVSASDDGTARVWESATGRELTVMRGHRGRVNTAVFSPDGSRVATTSIDRTAIIWSAATGRQESELAGHTGQVVGAQFDREGVRLVTASWDGSARVWDAESGEEQRLLAGHREALVTASFSPSADRVVTASLDGTVRVWPLDVEARVPSVLEGHSGGAQAAAFAPDGSTVVTGAGDGVVRLWNPDRGSSRIVGTHRDPVWMVAFDNGSGAFLSVSGGGAARLWTMEAFDPSTIEPTELVAAFDVRALRVLSTEEKGEFWLAHVDSSGSSDSAGAGADLSASVRAGAGLSAAEKCDTLAADPADPGHRGLEKIPPSLKSENVVAVCRQAVEEVPGEPRLSFQLGRALARGGDSAEASRAFAKAAAADYPAAIWAVAMSRLREGTAGEEAYPELRKAFDRGVAAAGADLAELLWNSGEDRPGAVNHWRRAAAMGDPRSHQRLAERYERGETDDEGERPLEQALFHYAVASRLYLQRGETEAALATIERRGTLARGLTIRTAATIADRANRWQVQP
ncbi:MAG: hypothetical protein HQL57_08835, partial [Magnetococcales bacterium]|nr:hypothetical protein [Magnetococcales bacterium]